MFVNLLADLSLGVIADIVIGVLAFIIIIVNMKKGFVKQIIGLIATILALVLAYLLCSKLTEFLNDKFGWHDKLAASISGGFADKGDAFNAQATAESVKAAVQSLGFPDFVTDAIVKLASSLTDGAVSVGQFVADVIAKYILLAASFVVLFIVIRLLLQLVKLIIVKIFTLPILKGIDIILGLVLGLIKVLFTVYVIVYVIELMPNFASFVESLKKAVSESKIISFINASGVVEECLKLFSGLIATLKL